MSLSPEEQKELELLQAELGDNKPVTETQTGGLTVEEQKELQMLRGELSSKNVDKSLKDQGFNIIEPEASFADKVGSFALGAAEALTLNNLDEMIAGTSAVSDIINDPNKSFSDFSATYDKYKHDARSTLNEAEQSAPGSSAAGQLIGTVATAAIPGGIGAKIAGSTLKSAIAVGTLRGVGKAENLRFDSETAEDIAMELGTEVAGFGIGKGIAKGVSVGRRLASQGNLISGKVEFARKQANALLDTIGVSGKGNFKKFHKDVLGRRGISEEQFMTDMLEDLPIQPDMNPAQVKKLIIDQKNRLWTDGVEKIFNDVDQAIPEGAINSAELRDRLLNDLGLSDQFIGKTEKEIQNIAKKVIPEIMVTTENNVGMRIIDAQSLLNRVKNTAVNRATKKTIDGTMRSVMEETVEKSLNPQAAAQFKNLKRKYGNLAESLDFIEDANASYTDALSKFDKATVNISGQIGALGDILKPGSTGKALERFVGILKNKAPLEYAPSQRLVSLNNVADKILENPDKYNGLVQRVITGAARSVDEFVDTMGTLEATINLEGIPIQRNLDDIRLRSQDIYKLLKSKDEQLANTFDRLMKEGEPEEVAAFMSSAAKLPGSKRFVQPGLGWNVNGKQMLLTETDRAEAKQVFKQAPISNKHKTVALETIEAGIMPPMPPVQQPMQRQIIRQQDKSGKKLPQF